jgi:type 2 lantibiotic biosynthesis protein LanM
MNTSLLHTEEHVLDDILESHTLENFNDIQDLGDFISPFILWADKHIKYYSWMEKTKVQEKCQAKLGEELLNICLKTLVLEITIKKLEMNIDETDSKKRLKMYLFELIKDKSSYKEFFTLYTQLLVVLIKKIRYFVNNFNEMSSRIDRDLDILLEKFNLETKVLEDIKVSLGDSHNEGATVCELVFGGKSIIYKPRDNKITVALSNFLEWLAHNSDFTYKRPIIINNKNYSWESKITNNPCMNKQQLMQYYRNFGYVAGVIYLLNGIDYHYENLIADGEYPMLIDNETILHPNINYILDQQYTNSYNILSSSLFPNPKIPFDLSALTGDYKVYNEMVETIQNIEDDNICFGKEQIIFQAQLNLPKLLDKKVSPSREAKEQILTGLKLFFETIISNREFLLGENSPLNDFKETKIRILLKHTMKYHEIKIKSLHPDHIKTDETQRTFIKKNLLIQNKFNRDTVKYEEESLMNLDIPYFYTFTNDINVYTGTSKNKVFTLEDTPFNKLMEKLKNLNEAEYLEQLELIKGLDKW